MNTHHSMMKAGAARSRGFSMVELMVAGAILATVGTMAAPAFNGAITSSRLTAFANNFVASALLARGEAIKRNATVRMCRSTTGTSCTTSGGWQQGWIVFHDINADGIVDTEETIIQYQGGLASGYQMTGANSLVFLPTGSAAAAYSLTLCQYSPVGAQERVITTSMTGRTSVKKTSYGVCS